MAFEVALGVGLRRSGQPRLQQPLRHHVGKAAVGRGRVGVVLHGQAEVAGRNLVRLHQHVLAGPHQLDHGQREVGKVLGVLLLLRQQKVVERLRVRLGGQRGAQPRGQLDNAVPALGRAHDAANGGHAGLLEGPRDDAVGRHHELLNQRGGAALFEARNLDCLLGQHHWPGLDGFQIERAMLEAAADHALRRRVLQLELRGQSRRWRPPWPAPLPCLPATHQRVIGQLRTVAHQRAIGLAIGDCTRLRPRQTR